MPTNRATKVADVIVDALPVHVELPCITGGHVTKDCVSEGGIILTESRAGHSALPHALPFNECGSISTLGDGDGSELHSVYKLPRALGTKVERSIPANEAQRAHSTEDPTIPDTWCSVDETDASKPVQVCMQCGVRPQGGEGRESVNCLVCATGSAESIPVPASAKTTNLVLRSHGLKVLRTWVLDY